MSTLFDSLKKLEAKEKELEQAVAKGVPSRGLKIKASFFQKRSTIVFLISVFTFIGFAFFIHLQYAKLNAAIFSQGEDLGGRLEEMTRKLTELDQKVKSLDTNSRMSITRLNGFYEELKREQNLRREAEAKQAKLVDEYKTSLKTSLDTQTNSLSERLTHLEDLERRKYLPSGRA